MENGENCFHIKIDLSIQHTTYTCFPWICIFLLCELLKMHLCIFRMDFVALAALMQQNASFTFNVFSYFKLQNRFCEIYCRLSIETHKLLSSAIQMDSI